MEIVVSFLYGLSSLIILSAFVPQILRLWKDQTQSKSMSVLSNLIFNMNAMVGLSYAVLVNKDPLFMITVGSSALCSFTMSYLVIRNRYLRPALQSYGVHFDSYAFYQQYASRFRRAALVAVIIAFSVLTPQLTTTANDEIVVFTE